MESISEIEFCIDQQYENEKGIFTVVSMHNDEMLIRWTNGEEILTEIELQQRIQVRRRREKIIKAQQAMAGNGSAKSKSGNQKGFQGLQFEDFTESAAQRTWRGRGQLGGAVTQKLPTNGFNFNSWAYAQKPEIHWSDVERRGRGNLRCQPSFFVRLDQLSLIFGFNLVRPTADSSSTKAWDAFAGWLEEQDGNGVIRELADDNSVGVFDLSRFRTKELEPGEKGWCVAGQKVKKNVASLTEYFESVPATNASVLEIAMKIDKASAVERGKDIAGDIANFFSRLVPLYRAAAL